MNEIPMHIEKGSSPLTVRCSHSEECKFSLQFLPAEGEEETSGWRLVRVNPTHTCGPQFD